MHECLVQVPRRGGLKQMCKFDNRGVVESELQVKCCSVSVGPYTVEFRWSSQIGSAELGFVLEYRTASVENERKAGWRNKRVECESEGSV